MTIILRRFWQNRRQMIVSKTVFIKLSSLKNSIFTILSPSNILRRLLENYHRFTIIKNVFSSSGGCQWIVEVGFGVCATVVVWDIFGIYLLWMFIVRFVHLQWFGFLQLARALMGKWFGCGEFLHTSYNSLFTPFLFILFALLVDVSLASFLPSYFLGQPGIFLGGSGCKSMNLVMSQTLSLSVGWIMYQQHASYAYFL